jgi:hypothetical protein
MLCNVMLCGVINSSLTLFFIIILFRFDQLHDYAQKLLSANPRVVKVKQNVTSLKEAKAELNKCWSDRNDHLQQALDLQVKRSTPCFFYILQETCIYYITCYVFYFQWKINPIFFELNYFSGFYP